MVVRIRLARFGKRNAPFYNIVVADARTARNSKPIEVIGTYDPIPKPPPFGQGKPYKDIQLDSSRAKYWLGVGAQPSEPCWKLLSLLGLMEKKLTWQQREARELPQDPIQPPKLPIRPAGFTVSGLQHNPGV
ncbi:MAG: 37S ribosomal protein S16, mitochondrial [Stictis urceolatum]|nr:37S ribosomal protein S16, mitochondrial [Stictis urceolata]